MEWVQKVLKWVQKEVEWVQKVLVQTESFQSQLWLEVLQEVKKMGQEYLNVQSLKALVPTYHSLEEEGNMSSLNRIWGWML